MYPPKKIKIEQKSYDHDFFLKKVLLNVNSEMMKNCFFFLSIFFPKEGFEEVTRKIL